MTKSVILVALLLGLNINIQAHACEENPWLVNYENDDHWSVENGYVVPDDKRLEYWTYIDSNGYDYTVQILIDE